MRALDGTSQAGGSLPSHFDDTKSWLLLVLAKLGEGARINPPVDRPPIIWWLTSRADKRAGGGEGPHVAMVVGRAGLEVATHHAVACSRCLG